LVWISVYWFGEVDCEIMAIRQRKGMAILAACVAAVLWVTATGSIPASLEIIRFALLAALP